MESPPSLSSGVARLLAALPRAGTLVLCAALVLLVGWIDYATGFELSFSIFYLLPIAIGAWRLGLKAALGLSLASAAIWLAADQVAGNVYSHPALPFWNATVRLGFFLVTSVILSRLRQAHEHEQELARYDPLTGLLNGRAFRERLESELIRGRRFFRELSLAYLDLDDFKAVNDSEGHSAGDELLRTIGALLQGHARRSDIVARLGGDEFVVLFPDTGLETATAAMARLQQEIVSAASTRGWPVTPSVGLVAYQVPPESVDDALEQADVRLYAAKAAGKNRLVAEQVD